LVYRAIPVIKFAIALAIGYKTLNGLSWFQIAERAVNWLPVPHKMTREEEERWFERASGPPP
jgi:hypothetical protein